jgi:hypothetical protein
MWNAAHKCSWPIAGDVYSWIGFLFGTKGNVMRKFPSSCKGKNLEIHSKFEILTSQRALKSLMDIIQWP